MKRLAILLLKSYNIFKSNIIIRDLKNIVYQLWLFISLTKLQKMRL